VEKAKAFAPKPAAKKGVAGRPSFVGAQHAAPHLGKMQTTGRIVIVLYSSHRGALKRAPTV